MEKEKERVSWKEKKEMVKETAKDKEREKVKENGMVKGEGENGEESVIQVVKGINEQNIITGTTGITSENTMEETNIKEKNEEESEKEMEEEETGMGKDAEKQFITERILNQKDLNKDVNKVENINMIKQDEHDKIENRPEEVITSEALCSVIHGHGKRLISSTSKNVELHRIEYSQREETKIEDGDISHENNEYYRHKIANGSELTVPSNRGTSDDLEGELITFNRKNLHVESRDDNDNDKEEIKDKSIKKEKKKEKEKERSKEIEKEREREREVGWSSSLSVHTSLSVARMLPSLLKGSSGSRTKSSSAQVCNVVWCGVLTYSCLLIV